MNEGAELEDDATERTVAAPGPVSFQLNITADPDPGVLLRVLERFQQHNIVPQRVLAELSSAAEPELRISVHVTGMTDRAFSRLTARLGQFVTVRECRATRHDTCPEK